MIAPRDWSRGVALAAVVGWITVVPIGAKVIGDGWFAIVTVGVLLFGLPLALVLAAFASPASAMLSRVLDGRGHATAAGAAFVVAGAALGALVLVAGAASLGSESDAWLSSAVAGASSGGLGVGAAWLSTLPLSAHRPAASAR